MARGPTRYEQEQNSEHRRAQLRHAYFKPTRSRAFFTFTLLLGITATALYLALR